MVPNHWTEAKVLTYGENIAFMPMFPLQRDGHSCAAGAEVKLER